MESIYEVARKYAIYITGSDGYDKNDLEEDFIEGANYTQT